MTLSFLPRIEAPRLRAITAGLDLRTLACLGGVFTSIDQQEVDEAYTFLQHVTSLYGVGFAVHLDVARLSSAEDIVSLLDAGVAKVFVSYEQLKQLKQIENINPERLVLKLSEKEHRTKDQVIEAIGDTIVGVYNEDVTDVDLIEGWLREYGDVRPPVYVSLDATKHENVIQDLVDLTRLAAISIVPASTLTVDEKANPDLIPVKLLLRVDSDRPDGLFSTIVTDERGIALGLVFSTLESVQESLRTGRGVYHSRKRGLWYKGESSGDIQELVKIDTDCDHDCLRFTVRQKGRGVIYIERLSRGEVAHLIWFFLFSE